MYDAMYKYVEQLHSKFKMAEFLLGLGYDSLPLNLYFIYARTKFCSAKAASLLCRPHQCLPLRYVHFSQDIGLQKTNISLDTVIHFQHD